MPPTKPVPAEPTRAGMGEPPTMPASALPIPEMPKLVTPVATEDSAELRSTSSRSLSASGVSCSDRRARTPDRSSSPAMAVASLRASPKTVRHEKNWSLFSRIVEMSVQSGGSSVGTPTRTNDWRIFEALPCRRGSVLIASANMRFSTRSKKGCRMTRSDTFRSAYSSATSNSAAACSTAIPAFA